MVPETTAIINQSRQSRRDGCTGGYAGIIGYGFAYECCDAAIEGGRDAWAIARSTSWGVRPLLSRKLIRSDTEALCALGSERNATASRTMSCRGV